MTCCGRPAIQEMNYRWPLFADPKDQILKINKVCLNCYTHWFGTIGNIKKYSKQEWDDEVNAAFKDEV